MKISKKDREYLIKNLEGAEELIEMDAVGDLLVFIEDALIEEDIKGEEDGPTRRERRLSEIFERIDEDNPE